MPREIDRLTISFRGDLQALNASVKQANSTIERFERAVNKRAARINTAFQAIGKAVRSALVPAALLIGVRVLLTALSAPIRAFREFETGMVEVGKVADVAGLELTDLGERIEALGASAIPIASKALLEITATAARLGVRGTENLQRFTAAVGGLTLATDISSGPGATNLARLLNVTAEPVRNIERVSSSLVHLGNTYATTESQILDFGLQLGRQTAAYGVAIQDVLGLAAAMSSFSTRAETSGTAVGQFFRIFNSAVRGNSKLLGEFVRVTGASVEELRELASTDLIEVLRRYSVGIGRIASEGGDAAAAFGRIGIDGRRAISELSTLGKRHDLLTQAIRDSRRAYQENLALYKEVARGAATLDSRIKILSNSFSAFARQGVPEALSKFAVDFLADVFSDKTIRDAKRYIDLIEKFSEQIDEINRKGSSGFDLIDVKRENDIEYKTRLLREQQENLATIPDASIRVFRGQFGNEADDLAERVGVSAAAVERYRRQLRGTLDELGEMVGPFQEIGGALADLLDTEFALESENLRRVSQEGGNAELGLTPAEVKVINEELDKLTEGYKVQISNQKELRVAIISGDDALKRAMATQKAKQLADKKGLILTDEQIAALAELLYQLGLETDAYRKQANALKVAERERRRLTEAVENAGVEQARTTEENRRLLRALEVGHEAHKETKRLIDAENVARRIGLDLKSDEAQAIVALELANARLNDEVRGRLDEYERHARGVEEIKDSIKDFAADAVSDFEDIGDAFRSLTRRIARLWFENVVETIFQQSGFNNLLNQVAGALLGSLSSGASSGPATGPWTRRSYYPNASREHGGPVLPGNLYRVNEGGRSETFLTPNQRGYILPAADTRQLLAGARSRASGINVYQNISVNTQVSGDEDLNRKLAETAEVAAASAMASFKKQISSGGELRRLVGSV